MQKLKDVKILEASLDNLDGIYGLICELDNEIIDRVRFEKMYENNLKDNMIHYIVAVYDLKVIGFASLHIQNLIHHLDKIGEIQEIIVSKAYQGNGLGKMLFEKIKDIALLEGCPQIEVCCNMMREKSHEFYLKNNMKKSHYKFIYRF